MIVSFRKILVYFGYFLAVIFFVLLAGYAVLLASGYKVDWRERDLIKTGIIAITTTPSRASVLLDNKSLSRLTPLSIKYLLPGEYDLRIERENYLTYQSRVLVKEGLVSDQRNLTLFLTQPTRAEIELSLSPVAVTVFNQNHLLLQDESGELFLYNQKEPKLLIEKWPKNLTNLKNLTLKQALVSTSGKTAVLLLEKGSTKRYLLWQENLSPRLLDKNAPNHFEDLYLDSDERLFSLAQDTIWLEDLKKNERSTIYKKGSLGIGFFDGRLLTVAKNSQGVPALIELSVKGDLVRPIIDELPTGDYFRLFKFGDSFFINAQTPRASTLWFYQSKSGGTLERLVSGFTGNIFEVGKYFAYQNQRELFILEKETKEQLQITNLLTPISLKSAYRRNLFFLQGNALRTIDVLGGGVNTIHNLESPFLALDNEARVLFTLESKKLVRYNLRQENGS